MADNKLARAEEGADRGSNARTADTQNVAGPDAWRHISELSQLLRVSDLRRAHGVTEAHANAMADEGRRCASGAEFLALSEK